MIYSVYENQSTHQQKGIKHMPINKCMKAFDEIQHLSMMETLKNVAKNETSEITKVAYHKSTTNIFSTVNN